MRRIVYASDLSVASNRAFTRALALAKRNRADLILLCDVDADQRTSQEILRERDLRRWTR